MGISRPGAHAGLSSTPARKSAVTRSACAAWTLRGHFSKTICRNAAGEKNRRQTTRNRPLRRLVPRGGVSGLRVVDLAVDEHGRRHQRRRRAVFHWSEDPGPRTYHARRRSRRTSAAVRTCRPSASVPWRGTVHGRRARRRLLAASAQSMIDGIAGGGVPPCNQDGVQSRQLLQRRSNYGASASRVAYSFYASRAAAEVQRAYSAGSSPGFHKARSCFQPRVTRPPASRDPFVGARNGLRGSSWDSGAMQLPLG